MMMTAHHSEPEPLLTTAERDTLVRAAQILTVVLAKDAYYTRAARHTAEDILYFLRMAADDA